jgi:hypothetical protein
MSLSNLSATEVSIGFTGSIGLIGSSFDGGEAGLDFLGGSEEAVDFDSLGGVVLDEALGVGLLSTTGCLGASAGFTSA